MLEVPKTVNEARSLILPFLCSKCQFPIAGNWDCYAIDAGTDHERLILDTPDAKHVIIEKRELVDGWHSLVMERIGRVCGGIRAKADDLVNASALVFSRVGISCSDVNVLRNPVPCKGCTCWFGRSVQEVLEVVKKAREGRA